MHKVGTHIVNAPARTTHRVLHVSDTHLSATNQAGLAEWRGLVKYTETTRPDLLVHTGDLVADDPDEQADHEFAADQWRRLTCPARVIPGNHDIGDSAPDPYRGLVSRQRLERYQREFGVGRWSLRVGSWLLVGLNSQLFDNVLEHEEQEQWDWFDALVSEHADAQLAVFMHKPPCISSLDEQTVANKTIGPGARARMLALAQTGQLRLIGCGHLHEYLTLMSYGVVIVAAPSLAMGAAPDTTRGLGLRCNGAVEYLFEGNSVRFQLLYGSELRGPVVVDAGELA